MRTVIPAERHRTDESLAFARMQASGLPEADELNVGVSTGRDGLYLHIGRWTMRPESTKTAIGLSVRNTAAIRALVAMRAVGESVDSLGLVAAMGEPIHNTYVAGAVVARALLPIRRLEDELGRPIITRQSVRGHFLSHELNRDVVFVDELRRTCADHGTVMPHWVSMAAKAARLHGRRPENVLPGSGIDSWRSGAACASEAPELFFPTDMPGPAILQATEAKSICNTCPVKNECLSWAVETGQKAGIWGGMSEDERRTYGDPSAQIQTRTA